LIPPNIYREQSRLVPAKSGSGKDRDVFRVVYRCDDHRASDSERFDESKKSLGVHIGEDYSENRYWHDKRQE
jgi:hypothetical protein